MLLLKRLIADRVRDRVSGYALCGVGERLGCQPGDLRVDVLDDSQNGSPLAVKLELILFAKPDGVSRGGCKAAAAVEAIADENGFFQPLSHGNLQFLEGLPYQQSNLLNKRGWAHQGGDWDMGNGAAVGCIVPTWRASLKIHVEASKFITLASTGRQNVPFVNMIAVDDTVLGHQSLEAQQSHGTRRV